MNYFTSDELILPEKGDLLISEPYLPDPNFERTVVLLCENDENGSFGFVLNKLANATLNELIEETQNFDTEVYIGGPVQRNTLHFLHRTEGMLQNDRKIVEGINWGVDFEKLLSHINTRQVEKEDFKFFVGYSGWSPGQLMDEVKDRAWIIYKKASPEMVFDMGADELWSRLLKNMGGKFRVISNYPIDPRLN